MKVATIYLLAANQFSSAIQNWAAAKAQELIVAQEKPADFFEATDSLLIFNQNQELSAETNKVKSLLILRSEELTNNPNLERYITA